MILKDFKDTSTFFFFYDFKRGLKNLKAFCLARVTHGSSQNRVRRLHPRNDEEGRVFARFSACRWGEPHRRSSLFTPVEIYRKCFASTYHGWGLQSLVSVRKKGWKGKKKKGKKLVSVVVLFIFSLPLHPHVEGVQSTLAATLARLSLWVQRNNKLIHIALILQHPKKVTVHLHTLKLPFHPLF